MFLNQQFSNKYQYYICGNKGIGATTVILWTLRKKKHISSFYFDYKMIISKQTPKEKKKEVIKKELMYLYHKDEIKEYLHFCAKYIDNDTLFLDKPNSKGC